jgi:cytosine/adenosine deaminase-related metal-dependent hydrolase
VKSKRRVKSVEKGKRADMVLLDANRSTTSTTRKR